MSITDENHGLFHVKMFYFLFFCTSNKSKQPNRFFIPCENKDGNDAFKKPHSFFFLMCSLHIVWNLLFWVRSFYSSWISLSFHARILLRSWNNRKQDIHACIFETSDEKSISTILVCSSIVDSRGKMYAGFRWLPSDVNILFVLYCSFIFVFIDFFYFKSFIFVQSKVLRSHY